MEKRKNNYFIILGIILIVFGTLGIIIYFSIRLSEQSSTTNDVSDYLYSTSNSNINYIEDKTTMNDDNTIEENIIDPKSTFLVLEIPRINLKRSIYNIESKFNDVEYNVQILKGSDAPNVVNGNIIFAAHNGNSKVSFFKKLYKLKEGDELIIYYDGIKYIYNFKKVYDIKKDGEAEIYRDKNKTTITLITCKKNIKDKQEVYIGYLDRYEKY